MDGYESTYELRKMLEDLGVSWMDIPQDNFKRTCWKMSSFERYFYFDDWGYASYLTCECSGQEAAEISKQMAIHEVVDE